MVFGQAGGISQLDPHTIASGAQDVVQTLLWNGLTKRAPDSSVRPDLAKTWQVSPDQRTWTFQLHRGVRFHDGKPFTARDAVRNIRRVLDPKVPAQVQAKLSSISDVRAEGAHTLVIDLSKPAPNLAGALIDVKMIDMDSLGGINKQPNGTGPYKLSGFIPDQSVKLVRNEQYWGPRPRLKELEIVRYADMVAALSAFRAGDLDGIWAIPPDSGSRLVSEGATLLEPKQPSSAAVWEIDNSSWPFNNPKARRALSYAANRDAMVKAAYGGHGTASEHNVAIHPENPYFQRGMPKHEFDLEKAKRLFAEAGVKPGTRLTYWTVSGNYPEWTTMGEILQQDLKKIGIDLEIKKNETSTWSAGFYPKGKKFPGMIAANYLSFPPLPDPYSLKWFSSDGTCECNWKAPQSYDKAVQSSASTADQQLLRAEFGEMQRTLNRQNPITVLAHTSYISVVKPDVRGAWVESDGAIHLEDAGRAVKGR